MLASRSARVCECHVRPWLAVVQVLYPDKTVQMVRKFLSAQHFTDSSTLVRHLPRFDRSYNHRRLLHNEPYSVARAHRRCKPVTRGDTWLFRRLNMHQPLIGMANERCKTHAAQATYLNMANITTNHASVAGNPKATAHHVERHGFRPKRVLMLTKLTRYEFEKKKHQNLSEDELKQELLSRGSNYMNLVALHRFHKSQADRIMEILRLKGMDVQMVDRFSYTDDAVAWADLIVTAGGDGTFLVGASGIKSCDKPVIGINTDPTRSEGHLLLPCDLDEIDGAFDKLASGEFQWKYRQRIRISVHGPPIDAAPIDLHNQQLLLPEHRDAEWTHEWGVRHDTHTDAAWPLADVNSVQGKNTLLHAEPFANADVSHSNNSKKNAVCAETEQNHACLILPDKALNEVFIGESHASRVSYYEIMVDEQKPLKQKSSGVLISSGTGSSSWIYNVNKLNPQGAREFLQIVSQNSGVVIPSEPDFIGKCIGEFNDRLLLDPSDSQLLYTIRDPVFNNTYFYQNPRGYAKTITVRSRCFDGVLVIDGSYCYKFNDGAYATFSIDPEDALKTVELC